MGEEEEKFPLCESTGHRPLQGRYPKRIERERERERETLKFILDDSKRKQGRIHSKRSRRGIWAGA